MILSALKGALKAVASLPSMLTETIASQDAWSFFTAHAGQARQALNPTQGGDPGGSPMQAAASSARQSLGAKAGGIDLD